MILVIGGAYQGKRAYAEQVLGCAADQMVPDVADRIRGMLEAGQDPVAEMPRLASDWADKVLLLEDVSSGVVPMDAMDRAFREAMGRCGAYLAGQATCVVRVFCGIGTVIKGA